MSLRHTRLPSIVLLLALALILPAPIRSVPAAMAQNAPDPIVEFLGNIGGSVTALDLSAGLAYIGEGSGLTILDVRDPARPARLGTAPLSAVAWDGQRWQQRLPCAGCVIDSTHNRVSVPVGHLTEYILVGDRRTMFLSLVFR